MNQGNSPISNPASSPASNPASNLTNSAAISKRRVVVTGIGLVDPFGEGKLPFFERLLGGENHQRRFVQKAADPIEIPAVVCDPFDFKARWGKAAHPATDRYSQLGIYAALEAWQEAGLSATEPDPNLVAQTGVMWGTALGGMNAYEAGLERAWLHNKTRTSPLAVVQGMNNSCASHLAIELGLGNACLTYSVACASGANAIGEGYRRIADGYASCMLVGGSDAPLLYGVIKAWQGMRVLAESSDDQPACQPFDQARRGLMLSEGAAALVLEDYDLAVARGATILAEIAGYGVNSDHNNLVRPNQAGQVLAMRAALDEAGLEPGDIGYINAHGTATTEGDPVEVAAIREVFGSHAAQVPVSATKSSHGHMKGATGAVEAAISVLALRYDALPPTANLTSIDPACEGVAHIAQTALRGTGVKAVMSNSFAFGGSNAVLVFKAI